MPASINLKVQQRVLGMFAYYSKWIFNFSEKIIPLIDNKKFPLFGDAAAFEKLKLYIANSEGLLLITVYPSLLKLMSLIIL